MESVKKVKPHHMTVTLIVRKAARHLKKTKVEFAEVNLNFASNKENKEIKINRYK